MQQAFLLVVGQQVFCIRAIIVGGILHHLSHVGGIIRFQIIQRVAQFFRPQELQHMRLHAVFQFRHHIAQVIIVNLCQNIRPRTARQAFQQIGDISGVEVGDQAAEASFIVRQCF